MIPFWLADYDRYQHSANQVIDKVSKVLVLSNPLTNGQLKKSLMITCNKYNISIFGPVNQ